jgi:hypothetical protein
MAKRKKRQRLRRQQELEANKNSGTAAVSSPVAETKASEPAKKKSWGSVKKSAASKEKE